MRAREGTCWRLSRRALSSKQRRERYPRKWDPQGFNGSAQTNRLTSLARWSANAASAPEIASGDRKPRKRSCAPRYRLFGIASGKATMLAIGPSVRSANVSAASPRDPPRKLKILPSRFWKLTDIEQLERARARSTGPRHERTMSEGVTRLKKRTCRAEHVRQSTAARAP